MLKLPSAWVRVFFRTLFAPVIVISAAGITAPEVSVRVPWNPPGLVWPLTYALITRAANNRATALLMTNEESIAVKCLNSENGIWLRKFFPEQRR
jgi:hypothetical protein